MNLQLKNGFVLCSDLKELSNIKGENVSSLNVATKAPEIFEGISGIKTYSYVETEEDVKGNICLSSLLLSDNVLDKCIEHVLSQKCEFMVRACEDLYETGLIESKYHLSPIMLLHKMGLLDNATVVGAVHIDRDDIDLMAQCGANVVFTPSYSMGKGFGIPPVKFALNSLPVSFGTANGAYNVRHSIMLEAYVARLICNAEAHKANAISDEELFSACGNGDIEEFMAITNAR